MLTVPRKAYSAFAKVTVSAIVQVLRVPKEHDTRGTVDAGF